MMDNIIVKLNGLNAELLHGIFKLVSFGLALFFPFLFFRCGLSALFGLNSKRLLQSEQGSE